MAWALLVVVGWCKVVQDLRTTDESEKVPRFFCGHIFQLISTIIQITNSKQKPTSRWDITGNELMKTFIKVVALFLSVCIMMTSCITKYHYKITSTEDEARARWKGATKQEIIQNFGPPNSEKSDGSDGTLLVYNMNRSDGETINRSHYIWFYLNSNNVCTNLKSDYFYKTERIPVRELSGAGIAGIVLLGGIGFAALCGLLASAVSN